VKELNPEKTYPSMRWAKPQGTALKPLDVRGASLVLLSNSFSHHKGTKEHRGCTEKTKTGSRLLNPDTFGKQRFFFDLG
jgi:hypothetical protein